MLKRSQVKKAQERTLVILSEAGIDLTKAEKERIEIAEFGLGELERTGLELLTYENNDRYCAKELVLFPRQTCPEHKHPPIGANPGKQETFRCRKGKVWLYIEGPETNEIGAVIPEGSDNYYTVFNEIELNPGDQFTIPPNTLHWFQAGDQGAIVSEFSSSSHDESDIFTDSRIERIPKIIED